MNAFPTLFLAGSAESNHITKGAFQEMDAISLLTPHVKIALRPSSIEQLQSFITNAYRTSWYGRPGPSFVDLPADIIMGLAEAQEESPAGRLDGLSSQSLSPGASLPLVPSPPKPAADPASLFQITQLLKSAKAPLIVIGKGAAYARAESHIRDLIDKTQIPFLPTPMGKGVVPDSHPLNASSARSTALQNADVALLLGARLNWILHYGEEPKWSSNTKFIQVDISAEELGRNTKPGDIGIAADLSIVVQQLLSSLDSWKYSSKTFPEQLQQGKSKNEATALKKASLLKNPNEAFTYERAFDIIKSTLHSMSPPDDGGIVYVSEGANTMDISRSVFPLHHPRLKLDAGTYATMGVGLGYAIAAHAAYNLPENTKKIVAIEGDSAFGFSAAEVETMARNQMPILIFVMNNSGIYHGDTKDPEVWKQMQKQSSDHTSPGPGKGLRSTTLLWETRYEMLAEMCGGKGYFVRTEEELEKATKEGFRNNVVTVVNVVVEPGLGKNITFAWQNSKKGQKDRDAKL
jgi:2-hydroxyacyl-CoA lyase 1